MPRLAVRIRGARVSGLSTVRWVARFSVCSGTPRIMSILFRIAVRAASEDPTARKNNHASQTIAYVTATRVENHDRRRASSLAGCPRRFPMWETPALKIRTVRRRIAEVGWDTTSPTNSKGAIPPALANTHMTRNAPGQFAEYASANALRLPVHVSCCASAKWEYASQYRGTGSKKVGVPANVARRRTPVIAVRPSDFLQTLSAVATAIKESPIQYAGGRSWKSPSWASTGTW